MRIGAPLAHVSQARARAAVQIDGDVEALAPQPAREREVVEQTSRARGVWARRSRR